MIDYDETEEDRIRQRQDRAERKEMDKQQKIDQKRFMYIFLYIPAFLPLLFNFYCLGGEEYHFILNYLLEKVQILQDVTIFAEPEDICVTHSGYVFSLAYLVVVCPFVYKFNRRELAMNYNYVFEGELKGLLIVSLVFIATFLFQNFVDVSSHLSQKYLAIRIVSFKFWPLFYIYFVLPMYMSAFFISGFLIRYNRRNDDFLK